MVAWTRALHVSSNPFRSVAKRVNMMLTMPCGVSASNSSGSPSVMPAKGIVEFATYNGAFVKKRTPSVQFASIRSLCSSCQDPRPNRAFLIRLEIGEMRNSVVRSLVSEIKGFHQVQFS